MARAIHKGKNGTQYVYESISYWDKIKKAPRTRQIYLGKLDPKTGELIPKRVPAPQAPIEQEAITPPVVKTIGSALLLDKVAKDSKLKLTLNKVFPKSANELLSLAYYVCCSNKALCHCESWSNDHKLPTNKALTSQNISRLLSQIDKDKIQSFMNIWAKRFPDKEMLFYDITSISSYAKSMDYVRWGYNRDHEALEQINLAMLYGATSRLPVFYRRLPGNITDVSTLQKTIKLLDYSGKQKLNFVMDMGFYSQENLTALYDNKYRFLLGVSMNRKWIKAIIDENYDSLEDAQNWHKDGNDSIYAMSCLTKHSGHRCYVHVYYNEAKKARSNDAFMDNLTDYKEKLEAEGLTWEGRKATYEQFLKIKETPARGLSIQYDNELIKKHKQRYGGMFVLISNYIKDSMEALRIYRSKDMVEKSFDDIKNAEDTKRLRVHSDRNVESRLFLSFLALILRSSIANTIRENKQLSTLGVARLLSEMNTLREVTVAHRYKSAITEPTKIQKQVIEAFDLKLS